MWAKEALVSRCRNQENDHKNGVRRTWKVKNTKVVPVIAGSTGMMTKNLTEILNIGVVPLGTHLVWLDKIIRQQ